MLVHFIVCRRERGWGNQVTQFPDEVQVMAASRTERGAKRAQKKLGGFIRRIDAPYRRYSQNEEVR